MRTLKGIIWLVSPSFLLLLLLSCRPVAQPDTPVRGIEEAIPAQAVTPTPRATPTLTPTPTRTPSPTPKPLVTPTRAVTRTPGPGSRPVLQPTYPPNMDLSVPPPPPTPPRRTFPPPKSKEEALAQVEEIRKEMGLKPGIIQKTEGPTTAGGKIAIGKTIIKLPDDAYIGGKILGHSCGPGPCLKAPIYEIIRSKSRIVFSAVDGEVSEELIAQGESSAFDFLKDYLKRKTLPPATIPVPAVKPPATTGSASQGADVEIGGKSLKLPNDTHIDAFIPSYYCFYNFCPKAPIYRVKKGESWIEFSAVDGEIVEERFAEGTPSNVFSSLKNSLNLKNRKIF